MASKATSSRRIAALSVLGLLGFVVLASAGYRAHKRQARDAAAHNLLASFLRVERLPASAHDLECQVFPDPCEPDNPSTICFVRIAPREFEQLARDAHFVANEHNCPENFSHSHVHGLTVGPSFKVNEEHWAGTEEAHVSVYPDAAHSQFIAVLSRPGRSSLHCPGPATVAANVRRGDG